MKYLGYPLPELEIIYPICAKGCRKIRDAEFLEDIRYIVLHVRTYMPPFTPQDGQPEALLGVM